MRRCMGLTTSRCEFSLQPRSSIEMDGSPARWARAPVRSTSSLRRGGGGSSRNSENLPIRPSQPENTTAIGSPRPRTAHYSDAVRPNRTIPAAADSSTHGPATTGRAAAPAPPGNRSRSRRPAPRHSPTPGISKPGISRCREQITDAPPPRFPAPASGSRLNTARRPTCPCRPTPSQLRPPHLAPSGVVS